MPYNKIKLNKSTAPMSTNSKKWLVTFTDLMALLLSFFALLISFNFPKQQELQPIIRTFTKSFGNFSTGVTKGHSQAISLPPKFQLNEGSDNTYLASILSSKIEKDSDLKYAQIYTANDGVYIIFNIKSMTNSVNKISPYAKRSLDKLVPILNNSNRLISLYIFNDNLNNKNIYQKNLAFLNQFVVSLYNSGYTKIINYNLSPNLSLIHHMKSPVFGIKLNTINYNTSLE